MILYFPIEGKLSDVSIPAIMQSMHSMCTSSVLIADFYDVCILSVGKDHLSQ